jgi:shikimate dehydrogenase
MQYELLDVEPEALARAWARLREPDCVGANVTMPYKAGAAAVADWRSDAVERCGAANLLQNVGGSLRAYNTDVEGMASAFARRRSTIEHGTTLVLGAGGAAAATLEALRRTPPRQIVLLARRPDAAEALVERAGEWLDVPLTAASIADAATYAGEASLVVNATAVGMKVDDSPPLELALLPSGAVVYDFIYLKGRLTELQRAALAAGLPVCDGALHLLEQAIPTFELLSGHPAPRTVLARALADAISREPLDWGADPG